MIVFVNIRWFISVICHFQLRYRSRWRYNNYRSLINNEPVLGSAVCLAERHPIMNTRSVEHEHTNESVLSEYAQMKTLCLCHLFWEFRWFCNPLWWSCSRALFWTKGPGFNLSLCWSIWSALWQGIFPSKVLVGNSRISNQGYVYLLGYWWKRRQSK